MIKFLLALLISVATILPSYGGVKKNLNVPFKNQHTQVWCWAAVSAMLIQYYQNIYVEDCSLLGNHFGYNCCQSPAMCTKTGSNLEIQHLLRSSGVSYGIVPRPFSYSEIVNEIQNGRPVIIELNSKVPGINMGHVILLTGYEFPDKVFVHDPLERAGHKKMHYPELFGYDNNSLFWKFSLALQ